MEKAVSPNFRIFFNQCIKKLITYYDTGFVFNHLDSIIALHIPYKDSTMTMQQYETNREIAQSTNAIAENTYSKFLKELELRETTFEQIRSNVDPNFAKHIQDFLSPEDYNTYLSLLESCTVDISSLISASNSVTSDYNDLLLELKDMVSAIVDSEETSRLSNMEDTFVLYELENLNSLPIDPKLQNNIQILKNELQNRTRQYQFFQELYSKGNKISITYADNKKSKSDDKNQERE